MIDNLFRSVEIYNLSLKLLCKIQTQRKLVNVIRWHPEFTASSEIKSQYSNWIAIGSNDSTIHVVNLDAVFGKKIF